MTYNKNDGKMKEGHIHKNPDGSLWIVRNQKFEAFHPLDELQRTQMNDRRAAQREIDREFEDFRREHT